MDEETATLHRRYVVDVTLWRVMYERKGSRVLRRPVRQPTDTYRVPVYHGLGVSSGKTKRPATYRSVGRNKFRNDALIQSHWEHTLTNGSIISAR